MVPFVPPEIVLHVFSSLRWPDRTATLLSCALVCREWRPLAQSSLLSEITFDSDPESSEFDGVNGLLDAAGREEGGWRCDKLETTRFSMDQLVTIFETATAVKQLSLDMQLFHHAHEASWSSFDWFAFDCLSELEILDLQYAPINPIKTNLVNLRTLSFDDACGADGALPSILAAAPNLKRLDICLDTHTPEVLAKCDSSVLKGLQHLTLRAVTQASLEPARFEVVLKFVADCSANLRSVCLRFLAPIHHAALLGAIGSHLDIIDMAIVIDRTSDYSWVGTELKKMALTKAAEQLKKWSVDLWIRPPADDQLRSRAGPLAEGAWEDGNWAEWVAMCDKRGVQRQVSSNVEWYNEAYFPQTSAPTA